MNITSEGKKQNLCKTPYLTGNKNISFKVG